MRFHNASTATFWPLLVRLGVLEPDNFVTAEEALEFGHIAKTIVDCQLAAEEK